MTQKDLNFNRLPGRDLLLRVVIGREYAGCIVKFKFQASNE